LSAEASDIRAVLTAPRYTSRPFPAYRFTPGRDPHPTANPLGHSYQPAGEGLSAIAWYGPDRWEECDEYLYGCDLYNHGYWWEAHEAWEEVWHLPERASAEKHFLQGLIQVSACHLKRYLGHLDGVRRLRVSSEEHFSAARQNIQQEIFMGIDVQRFLGHVQRYYDNADEKARLEVSTFPYVVLRRDA